MKKFRLLLLDANVVILEASQMRKFCEHFDSVYLEKLDSGEAESLAYLFTQSDECMICSADKIVFRVLGGLNRPDQGVSLDEVLGQIGLGRKLGREFTKAYKEEWTQKGGYANCGNYPPALKANKMYFAQAIIWDKEHPVLTRKDFMGAHEWCFYGWKEDAGHKFFGPNNATDLWHVKKVNPNKMGLFRRISG